MELSRNHTTFGFTIPRYRGVRLNGGKLWKMVENGGILAD